MGSIGIFDFCGEKHEVHLSIQSGQTNSFRVRVRNSTKSWSNTFNANYIEQLTGKTGSYKEFSTFVSMLSGAITNPGINKYTCSRLFVTFIFKEQMVSVLNC